MEPGIPLYYKGDEPFRAPHILLIPLAQMLLQDALFHTDTVAEANQRASHNDQQTQPVSIAESKSEQRDEHTSIGGMTNEAVGTRFDQGLIGCDCHLCWLLRISVLKQGSKQQREQRYRHLPKEKNSVSAIGDAFFGTDIRSSQHRLPEAVVRSKRRWGIG